MARIKIISYEESEGRLRDIYDDIIEKRGQLAEVHAIQSLNPETIVQHMDLYMQIMYRKSELSRADREMIAVVVSSKNHCEYCQVHHGAALLNYWNNKERVIQLRRNYKILDLTAKERALCDYAERVTTDPKGAKQNDLTIDMKAVGLSDAAILDATLIVAYFNFVNRIVMGLDVDLESDHGKGYKY